MDGPLCGIYTCAIIAAYAPYAAFTRIINYVYDYLSPTVYRAS